MDKKTKAVAPNVVTTAINEAGAKVINSTDLYKVWCYFRYKVGTTLDCAQDTGILRNSITYYVAYLESIHELQAIFVKPDSTTGFKAKHYSADKAQWHEVKPQPTLFDDESLWEGC